ncbi:chaperonin 10-like protein [Coniochaeta sp. 2T2.1]|nr:chaperonin 10-like protein [Coniochaeta sp. 2T2.1]
MATATLPVLPRSRQAIVQSATTPGSFELCTNLPLPAVPPDHVLIKVIAVAVNHCDYKMPSRVPCPGAVDGSDFSGVVVRLGKSVARTPGGLQIGDRVAGAQMGNQRRRPWSGAFTEYIAEKAENIWRVPEHLSWEQAASIGCAVTTSVGMALWWVMKLPGTPEKPTPDPKFVLVYGGSTASGTFAIQLLKLSGYRVVTTCSPKNFQLVEEYGAEKAFDYHSPTCGEDIRTYTKNTLEDALDIITEARTLRQCYAAIGRGGGRYIGFELLPDDLIATMRKTVKPTWVLGLEVIGEELDLPGGYYRKENPELHAWVHTWIKHFVALYEAGKLKPHPIQVNQGGLAKVMDGIGSLRRKEVSARKLVYPLLGLNLW